MKKMPLYSEGYTLGFLRRSLVFLVVQITLMILIEGFLVRLKPHPFVSQELKVFFCQFSAYSKILSSRSSQAIQSSYFLKKKSQFSNLLSLISNFHDNINLEKKDAFNLISDNVNNYVKK